MLQVVLDRVEWSGNLWSWLASIDLNLVGFLVVGLFVTTWALALIVWHISQTNKIEIVPCTDVLVIKEYVA